MCIIKPFEKPKSNFYSLRAILLPRRLLILEFDEKDENGYWLLKPETSSLQTAQKNGWLKNPSPVLAVVLGILLWAVYVHKGNYCIKIINLPGCNFNQFKKRG